MAASETVDSKASCAEVVMVVAKTKPIMIEVTRQPTFQRSAIDDVFMRMVFQFCVGFIASTETGDN
jgi:hypothetical protein